MNRLIEEKNRSRDPVPDSQLTRLIKEAQTGDKSAFTNLVDRFYEDMFRMVFFRTRSRMDAEDITQDIFIKVSENLSHLKDTERFKAWLFKIGLNKIRDFYRKKRVLSIFRHFNEKYGPDRDESDRYFESQNINEENARPDAIDRLLKKEFWEHVGSFLDSLPHMEQEVFIMRFMDNLHIKEISEALNKNENTIKTHLYRALHKFKHNSTIRNYLRKG